MTFHPKALKAWVRFRRVEGDTMEEIKRGVRFLELTAVGLTDTRLRDWETSPHAGIDGEEVSRCTQVIFSENGKTFGDSYC